MVAQKDFKTRSDSVLKLAYLILLFSIIIY